MSLRSSALIWSRSIGFATLLAVMAGCSSVPQSSTPTAPAPTATSQPSPQSSESPTAAPQSVPPQPPADSEPKSPASNTSRTVERCVVRMAKVNDPESPLNVRSSPNATSKENIVGQLRNGTYVSIQDEQNGWYKISGETPGWIAKSKTESNCSEKIERVEFGKGQDSIEIVDRFIGGGSHKYVLNLEKGQKLAVTSDRDVFPTIVAPNGKELTNYRDNRKSWTGEVPATGDYAIIFDSNFKGYEYAIAVEAR